MAKMMMIMFLFGTASAAYQGGGDQTYDTDDEHLGHGGPGGSSHAEVEVPQQDNDYAPGTASSSHQGGGVQTYHTEDEHLGHGGPGGNGSIGLGPTGYAMLLGFFAVVVAMAFWAGYYVRKTEETKPQPVLEMTVGADLEEAVERKESKSSQISTAASDVPLTSKM